MHLDGHTHTFIHMHTHARFIRVFSLLLTYICTREQTERDSHKRCACAHALPFAKIRWNAHAQETDSSLSRHRPGGRRCRLARRCPLDR